MVPGGSPDNNKRPRAPPLPKAGMDPRLVTLCVGAGMGTATIIERV